MSLTNSSSNASAPIFLIQDHDQTTADIAQRLNLACRNPVASFGCVDELPWDATPSVLIADLTTIGEPEIIDQLRFTYAAPVIVLSDRPSMALAVRVMRAGASDFFPNPVSVTALADRIHGLIDQGKAFQGSMVQPRMTASKIAPFSEQEREIIENAISTYDGNVTKAAAALQISPSTIYRKMQNWGVAVS